MWTYRCYDDGGTPNLWKRWYDANTDVQGSHDSVFDILEQLVTWREPHAKIFDKKSGIIELRFSGMVQHRLMGFYGSLQREFVILAPCYHKGKVYTPKGIRDIAVARKDTVLKIPGKAPSCARPR